MPECLVLTKGSLGRVNILAKKAYLLKIFTVNQFSKGVCYQDEYQDSFSDLDHYYFFR